MQRKEQKVILLEDLPDQAEYQMAQPKGGASSRRSSSKLAKGPLGGTGPQAIAGTATTSTVLREPRVTGQRGGDSYHQADVPTDGEQTIDRTSSVEVEGHENSIGPHDVRNDVTLFRKSDEGGDTSDSDDDDQLSIAHAASMACASGEDSRAMAKDDQHAGSSRAVDSDNQSAQRETSTGVASTGERVPTTSTAAGRSYESAVSGAQRPLHPTVRTRSSSAATNKRDLSAQGRRRNSPLVPLLELPAPPRSKPRPAPAMRREYGFSIGTRQSGRVGAIPSEPDSEPDPDEQDMELDAWMASVAVESKSTDTPAVTIQVREASDDVPASRVDTLGEPQGDQHITMTSMEIESTENVPGSSVTANGGPRGDQHITMSSRGVRRCTGLECDSQRRTPRRATRHHDINGDRVDRQCTGLECDSQRRTPRRPTHHHAIFVGGRGVRRCTGLYHHVDIHSNGG